MRALIIAAALCGCQRYDDLAGPVSEPSRHTRPATPARRRTPQGRRSRAMDSSETCWNGDRPHMVQYSRPRLPKRTCGESLYMPEGQVRRWFGCPKKPVGDPI